MAKERIRKIARRLDVSVEEIVNALASLGHSRYRLPDDMLPDQVVDELEQVLRKARAHRPLRAQAPGLTQPPGFSPVDSPHRPGPLRSEALPSAIHDDPVLNAALQEYRSARPLSELRRSLPSHGPSREVVPPPRSTEDVLRDSLGAEIRQRRLLGEALEQARAELARVEAERVRRERQLSVDLDALRTQTAEREATLLQQVVSLEAELKAFSETDQKLRRDLEAIRARLADELVERQVAQARTAQLERRLRDMETRISVASPRSGPPTEPVPTPAASAPATTPLDELFEERGLLSPAEVRAAFDALLRDANFYDTMEVLATSSASVIRNLLRRKLSILCENCDAPTGTLPLRVEPMDRCEICHGESTADAGSRFLAVCRARGITRVNLVGGTAKQAAELKELLATRIELRIVDGTWPMDARRAGRELDAAELTIVWSGGTLDHRVAGVFRELNDSRVVPVVHRGLGGMLRLVTEVLERRWTRSGGGGASLFQ